MGYVSHMNYVNYLTYLSYMTHASSIVCECIGGVSILFFTKSFYTQKKHKMQPSNLSSDILCT